MKYLTYICLLAGIFFLAMPDLSAADPVPGLDLSLQRIPGGKTFKTKTNRNGEFSFKNLPDGNYVLTISYKGQSAVVGKKSNEKIVVFGSSNKASGQPTGIRQHKPITITKQIDKASPKLASALAASYNSSRSNKSENRTSDPNTTGTNKRTKYSNITLKKGIQKAGNNKSMRGNPGKLDADKVTPILTIKVDGDLISGSLKMKHDIAMPSIRNTR